MLFRSRGVQIAVVIVAAVGWKLLADRWGPASDVRVFRLGIAAMVVLGAYTVGLLILLAGPWLRRGRDHALGRFVAWGVIGFVVLMAIILGVALAYRVRWVIMPISTATLFTLVLIIGGLAAEGIKKLVGRA